VTWDRVFVGRLRLDQVRGQVPGEDLATSARPTPEELKAALQARWEDSLRQRAARLQVSAVPLLNRLLASIQPAISPIRSRLAPKIGHRPRRIANRRSLDSL
jgi:hypothetical protein